LYFGITVADAESVPRLRARLAREDVQTSEIFESENRVAFHCADPDGYRVEVFWAA
jgi:hypothetical protein